METVRPEQQRSRSDPVEIHRHLRRLEHRDWWLWGTAVLIMLLLTFGIFTLSFPGVWQEQNPFYWLQLNIAVRGLFGLVLLFSLFVVYQQVLIRRLRQELGQQLADRAALEARAENFEHLAVIDPLTELYNRRFATEHLPIEIARATRQGYALTLLMLDLNGFKAINDQYGHAAGDLALLEFARHLKRCFRTSDLAVRMGGDEFMVLLPECSSQQVPKALTHLRGLIVEHGGHTIQITFAAGWAEYQPGESATGLLARADQSLYAEKHTCHDEKPVGATEAQNGQALPAAPRPLPRGVADDFSNLLTIIRGHSELMFDSIHEDQALGKILREHVREIDDAVERAADLTRQLRHTSGKKQPR